MTSLRLAGALGAAAVLAVPATAGAHPSVYTDTARVMQNGALTDQTRHVVTNHGFTAVFRETNGLGAPNGVLTFSRLPNPYRGTIPFSQWIAEGGTGAQVHATCRTAALQTEAAIEAWQGEDPFYAYVPFQKEAAGFEDDPATWIPVVAARTGVDLATAPDPEAACEALPGGVYTPADEVQTTTAALNAGYLEHETAPLTAEIASLKTAVAGALAALQAARDEIARLTAAAAPLRVALPTASPAARSLAEDGTTVTVSGPAGARAAVVLTVSRARARKLGMKSPLLGRADATVGAGGTVAVPVRLKPSARRALGRLRRPAALTVTARAGDRIATTTATVSR